jgi:transcriptional regulator
VVPTWNYVTAHVYGRLVIHDDPAWVEVNVRRLSERHERSRERPWSVDDAPEPYIAGQLKAIVGVEIVIDRVEGKWKLSQNRSEADVAGTIEGLEAAGEREVSAAMRGLDHDR